MITRILSLSRSLSLYLPQFLLSPSLSGCVQRPIKYYIYIIIGAQGETTVDGYESTGIPVGQYF